MNTFLKLSFVLLFVSVSYANNVINNLVKLPKHFKVEHTFSGDLNETESFHLIFSKNKKNKLFTIHPYVFDGTNITPLDNITNDSSYSLVSFHRDNNILSLLLSFKEDKKDFIKRININLLSKEIEESDAIENEDFSTSIREENRSILINKNKKEIRIVEFKNKSDIKVLKYSYNKRDDKYRDFFDANIEAVKTNEFVANGSVAELRAYLDGENIIFTKEIKENISTEVVSIPLNKKELFPSKILVFKLNNSDNTYKKITSFYHDKKLYQFANNKKHGEIKITSTSSKKGSTIKLDQSLTQQLVQKHNFKGFDDFLKAAGKSKYNTTLTINNTEDGNLKVRVDYVNIEYSYHYNWWWHHRMMHMHMMHQQIQFNAPAGFGPTQPNDFHFNTYDIPKEKRYFEFVINNQNEVISNTKTKTLYKEVDKKEYIDKLEEIQDYKQESSCFLENSFRFIAYSKKNKGFIIQTNTL